MKEVELVEGVELEVSRGRFVGEGPWRSGAGDADGVIRLFIVVVNTRFQTPRTI
jgi:hypothetical protein